MTHCIYCVKLERYFNDLTLQCKKVSLNEDASLAFEVVRKSEQAQVPLVYIDGEKIGGYSDTLRKHKQCIKNRDDPKCSFFV